MYFEDFYFLKKRRQTDRQCEGLPDLPLGVSLYADKVYSTNTYEYTLVRIRWSTCMDVFMHRSERWEENAHAWTKMAMRRLLQIINQYERSDKV